MSECRGCGDEEAKCIRDGCEECCFCGRQLTGDDNGKPTGLPGILDALRNLAVAQTPPLTPVQLVELVARELGVAVVIPIQFETTKERP